MYNANKRITQSEKDAQLFLNTLSEKGLLTFQTFDDGPKKRRLARILQGTYSQHRIFLRSLNDEGAGIFVMVNEGDGNGRSNVGVLRTRAIFVDTDGATYPAHLPLEPHVVVQTSPSRWHIYWLVDGIALDDFGNIQAALAEKYGTDPTITDRCRVMRIPGFYHHKRDPFMVQLLHVRNAAPYTAAQVFNAWTEIAERIERERGEAEKRMQEAVSKRAEAGRRRENDQTRSWDEKRAQGILQATCDGIATTTSNRNNALLKASRAMGGYIAGSYLTEDEVTNALTLAAGACGLETKEISGCISRGISYGLAHPLFLGDSTNQRSIATHLLGKPKSRRSRMFTRMKGWANGGA